MSDMKITTNFQRDHVEYIDSMLKPYVNRSDMLREAVLEYITARGYTDKRLVIVMPEPSGKMRQVQTPDNPLPVKLNPGQRSGQSDDEWAKEVMDSIK